MTSPYVEDSPAAPRRFLRGVLHRWSLLPELVKRDFAGRYKGSMLGILWSLFNPLLMLAIYTFVFSVALKARWGIGEESRIAFAVVLFSGMIVHSFFAECLNRAPGLITSNPNYVKKVVFPLELLPVMVLFSALLHLLVSLAVLLAFCLLAGIEVHAGTFALPLVLLPLMLMTLGISWILASLGVYLRDLAQIVGVITTVALFLAPVFYPVEALPANWRVLLAWNPITLPVIQLREAMLWGTPLQWDLWAASLAMGVATCLLGYWWFQKSRRGFADVL
jgi:lipopolysaccharide transport system permease protein